VLRRVRGRRLFVSGLFSGLRSNGNWFLDRLYTGKESTPFLRAVELVTETVGIVQVMIAGFNGTAAVLWVPIISSGATAAVEAAFIAAVVGWAVDALNPIIMKGIHASFNLAMYAAEAGLKTMWCNSFSQIFMP
jgi:hypothetical protein